MNSLRSTIICPFESVLVFGFACTAHPNRHGNRSKTSLLNRSSFFHLKHLDLRSPSHALPPFPGAQPGTHLEQVKMPPVS